MKVFISSVISGYEAYRAAAQDAVETLGHDVIRAEDFKASPSSPRVACLDGVRDSDLVILLLGRRYGGVQASGLSATHEEFGEAHGQKDILAFIESVAEREERQTALVREVQDWQTGLFTDSFASADDLRRKVTKALHEHAINNARTSRSASDFVERAQTLTRELVSEWSGRRASLAVVVAGDAREQIIRPSKLNSPELDEETFQLATRGPSALLSRREGTQREVTQEWLRHSQRDRFIMIHADGSIAAKFPLESNDNTMVIIEEDVIDGIERALTTAGLILSQIDRTERLRNVCVAAAITDASYSGWMTREQFRNSSGSISLLSHSDEKPVHLRQPVIQRATLRNSKREIAEDLTVLLRHQFT